MKLFFYVFFWKLYSFTLSFYNVWIVKINICPNWTALLEEPVIEYCDIKSEVVEQAVLCSRNTRENNDRTPTLLWQCLLISRLCCKPIWNCFNCQGTGEKKAGWDFPYRKKILCKSSEIIWSRNWNSLSLMLRDYCHTNRSYLFLQ